jgi:hypothetical protein
MRQLLRRPIVAYNLNNVLQAVPDKCDCTCHLGIIHSMLQADTNFAEVVDSY